MKAGPQIPATLADSAEPGSKVTYRRLHLRLLTLAFSGPMAHLEEPFLDEYHRD
jgi:hypothetical protein